VFTDEDQWISAFNAAEFEVKSLLARGILTVSGEMPERVWIKHVAVKIATAAINGGSRVGDHPMDDIASLPGVEVELVDRPIYYPPVAGAALTRLTK
jgi:hypothetical protein